MKKLLAVLLTAVMLLSACALAEGRQITLGNVMLLTNGDVIGDFSDFTAELQYAADGDRGGVNLSLNYTGEELCSVLLAMLGSQIVLQINADNARSAYYLDLTALLGVLGESISLDMIVDSFSEALAGSGSPFSALGEQLGAVLADSVIDGGVTDIGGEEYNMLIIDVSAEQMRALIEGFIDMLVANGTYTQAQAEETMNNFFSLGQEISLNGAIYGNADSGIINLTCYVAAPGLDAPIAVNFFVMGSGNNEAGYLFNVSLEASDGENSYGVAFNIAAEKLYDVSWLPENVGGATDILTVEDIESTLTKDFETLAEAAVNRWLHIMTGVAE